MPTIVYPFFDDMENSVLTHANWLSSSWELDDNACSGDSIWTDSPWGNYPYWVNLGSSGRFNSSLTLAGNIELPADPQAHPQLMFQHHYEIGSDWGYVEISENDGHTWDTRATFRGTQPDCRDTSVDLSGYFGRQIRIRFRLWGGASSGYDGWYVDDVRISDDTAVIVKPSIYVTPAEFSVPLLVDSSISETLSIRNEGDGHLTFVILEAVGGGSLTTASSMIRDTEDVSELKGVLKPKEAVSKGDEHAAKAAATLDGNQLDSFTKVDVPWVTENPISGIVPPGDTAEVVVTFDAGGLDRGSYHAYLVIMNNDPDSDVIVVELHLSVNPPGSFSLLAPPDEDTISLPDTLYWERAIDPDPGDTVRYDVWLSTEPDFSNSVVKVDSLVDSSTSITCLPTGSAWYWKVRAYDQLAAERWSNQSWSFEFVSVCCQIRGDVDHSGSIDVADLTYLVSYLFKGGASPPCEEEGNVDGLCGHAGPIDVADLTYLVDYLYRGGDPPPPCP